MRTRPETFRSSGAFVFGLITVVGSLALAALAAFHPRAGAPDWLPVALVLLAVVVYIAEVRPAVVMGESALELRNMLATVHVPWAAVGETRVRQFVTVSVGGEEYNCAAVGRTRRQISRDNRGLVADRPIQESFGRFVETKIRNRASEARAKRGIAKDSPEQAALFGEVTRVPAWAEIVVLTATVVTLVITILL